MNAPTPTDPLARLANTYAQTAPSSSSPTAAAPNPKPASAIQQPQPQQPRQQQPSAEERLARTYRDPDTKPEAKPDTKPGDERAPTGEKPTEAPALDLKAPEGMAIAPEVATTLSSLAHELNIGGEAMQKLVDKVSPVLHQQTQSRVAAMIEGWAEETFADPDLGGENFDATAASVMKALSVYGSPELRTLLSPPENGGTGLGNHPALVRFLARVGQAQR